MFFADQDQGKKQPSDFDLDCAKKLHDSVFHRYKNRVRWSQKNWANEFRILRNDLDDDQESIQFVLDWVCGEIENRGSVTVSSAKGFRKGFIWLQQKANKHGPAANLSNIPKEQLETFLTFMHEEMTRFGWPEGVEPQLREFLITGYANYLDYVKRLKVLWLERDNYPKVKYFLEDTKERLHQPETIMLWWLRKLREVVFTWEEFNGSIKPFVLNVKYRWFTEMMADRARRFGVKPTAWYTLLKLMGYGSNEI